jgi:hypothetical protein
MTNFQIQKYKAQVVREFAEQKLMLLIFRQVWPNLQNGYLLLIPDGEAAEEIPVYTVKHKKKHVSFCASLEHIEGRDHVFLKPYEDGSYFFIERINKRKKH